MTEYLVMGNRAAHQAPSRDCLGHEEIGKVIQDLNDSLEWRVAREDFSKNSITVNIGPKFVSVSLENIHRFLSANKKSGVDWESQKFHSIPIFTEVDRLSHVKHKHKWQSIQSQLRDQYPDMSEVKIEMKVIQAYQETEDKNFSSQLAEEAELEVQRMIEEGMKGRRGLLIRGFKCEEDMYEKLSTLLGIRLVPSCSEDHQHRKECYRMESDIILVYPYMDKLAIRLIEVKRPNSIPWAKYDKKSVKPAHIAKAGEQLVKAIRFSLAFLPEVSSDKLDVKAVMAFPESECQELFCEDCSQSVISKEDMDGGPQRVLEKLSVQPNLVTAESETLFLTICSRLIGTESLLHQGKRLLTEKFTLSKEAQKKNFDLMEKGLILLSNEQRELYERLETADHLKHFFFSGGSGTGKTQMSLLTLESLMKRYEGRNVQIYITYCTHGQEKNFALRNTFEAFKEERSSREQGHVTFHISSLESLSKKVSDLQICLTLSF